MSRVRRLFDFAAIFYVVLIAYIASLKDTKIGFSRWLTEEYIVHRAATFATARNKIIKWNCRCLLSHVSSLHTIAPLQFSTQFTFYSQTNDLIIIFSSAIFLSVVSLENSGRRKFRLKENLPLYKIVEPLVASSGECGGGLGAVVPAVGDDGPQQDVGTAVTALVLLALCMPVVCESPTTSISSSSSMVCVVDAPLLIDGTFGVLVDDTVAVTVVVLDDGVDDGWTVSIVVCVESSERSCHGYAFHFFAIKQRGIVQNPKTKEKHKLSVALLFRITKNHTETNEEKRKIMMKT